MIPARTLACALLFSVLPLLAGCSRSSERRVEDLEPEKIRKERRMRLEKLMPAGARPTDAGAEKK
jgi:hypothetical protein